MKNYLTALSDIFNTSQCLDYIRGIWETDRFFDYKSFAKTADYCFMAMQNAGLKDIKKQPIIADGKTPYGDWVLPRAWDVDSAILRVCDDDWVLADYNMNPCSLVMYSAPTLGVEAECLLADEPDKLLPCHVKGKILFTKLHAAEIADFAAKSGAIGIVSDYMRIYPGIRDSREQVYDTSMWINNFNVPINDTGLFAFSLTPRNGDALRKRLISGENIRLYAKVKSHFYDGEAHIISGLIPGETDEEICFYGHLYEPGAHDNASGCAVILELARGINQAIEHGHLPKPKHGLRFIMGPECTGSTAYFIAHENRKSRACIVLDMVGTQDIDNTIVGVWHNPIANISLIDALIISAIEEYEALFGSFEWKSIPFSIGTDNIVSDPSFGMPTIALIAEPALSYHSSYDTPERIEPDVIKRNAVIAGACALTLAYGKNGAGKACRVYTRKVKGCLTFDSNPKLKVSKWNVAWSKDLNTPLFWMDGRRTLWEVAVLSCCELRKDNIRDYFKEICEYTDFLCENGYIL